MIEAAKRAVKAAAHLFGYQLERRDGRLRLRKEEAWHLRNNYLLIVRRIVPDARVMFVLGAFHGANSRDLLKAFPEATVYSFEPDPENFEHLQRNLASSVRAVNISAAVGDFQGTVTLNQNSSSGTNSLLQTASAMPQLATVSRVMVPMITLDSFCAAHGIDQVDYIHADLQGYEAFMLRGATRMLSEKKIRSLLLEVSFENFYEGQSRFEDLYATMVGYGYRFVCTQGMYFEPGAIWPRGGNVVFASPLC